MNADIVNNILCEYPAQAVKRKKLLFYLKILEINDVLNYIKVSNMTNRLGSL